MFEDCQDPVRGTPQSELASWRLGEGQVMPSHRSLALQRFPLVGSVVSLSASLACVAAVPRPVRSRRARLPAGRRALAGGCAKHKRR